MFTLILLSAQSSFFRAAGTVSTSRIYDEATAADALRIAREYAASPLNRAVGIRVGNRRKSPVLWVK